MPRSDSATSSRTMISLDYNERRATPATTRTAPAPKTYFSLSSPFFESHKDVLEAAGIDITEFLDKGNILFTGVDDVWDAFWNSIEDAGAWIRERGLEKWGDQIAIRTLSNREFWLGLTTGKPWVAQYIFFSTIFWVSVEWAKERYDKLKDEKEQGERGGGGEEEGGGDAGSYGGGGGNGGPGGPDEAPDSEDDIDQEIDDIADSFSEFEEDLSEFETDVPEMELESDQIRELEEMRKELLSLKEDLRALKEFEAEGDSEN